MVLERWKSRRSERAAAERLYVSVVKQARHPYFYRERQIPDSLDGRFELIALHVFLVLHRLKASHPAAQSIAQALHDHFFADMDRCLREMGAGDLGVGRRVKRMAEGLYGRISAYEAALDDDGVAEAALRRNLYGTEPAVEAASIAAMVAYLRAQAAALAAQETTALQAGEISFLPAEIASETGGRGRPEEPRDSPKTA